MSTTTPMYAQSSGTHQTNSGAFEAIPGLSITLPEGVATMGLVFLNVPAMQQPEAYIGGLDKLFDANGKLANEGTQKFLQGFLQSFAAWVAANHKA